MHRLSPHKRILSLLPLLYALSVSPGRAASGNAELDANANEIVTVRETKPPHPFTTMQTKFFRPGGPFSPLCQCYKCQQSRILHPRVEVYQSHGKWYPARIWYPASMVSRLAGMPLESGVYYVTYDDN